MIKFENVSKIYSGQDRPALESVNIEIVKGEFVFLLPPPFVAEELLDHAQDKKLLTVLLQELPLKKAVKIAAELSTTKKNILYELALQLRAC